MSCFFKSKNKKRPAVSVAPSSQGSPESGSGLMTAPSRIAPSNPTIKALENKVNELEKLKLKERFSELREMMDKLKILQIGTTTVKEDMSRKLGHNLALQLINQVSQASDPMAYKPANVNNPWGWLSKHHHFKKFIDKNPDLLPLSHIMGRYQKSGIEQLYLELKSLKEKGYMETLKTVDPDVHDFLCLSHIIGAHFLAGPRIVQITALMLLRSRIELGIHWQVWERCPQKWAESCNTMAEPWLQIVMECINEKGQDMCDRLPKSSPELAKEFDGIEEFSRRNHGLPPREAQSFDTIVECYKDFKESGLLTADVRNRHFVSCTFLDSASEIRDIYKTRTVDKNEKRVLTDTFGRSVKISSTSMLKPAPDTGRIIRSTSQPAISSDNRKHTCYWRARTPPMKVVNTSNPELCRTVGISFLSGYFNGPR